MAAPRGPAAAAAAARFERLEWSAAGWRVVLGGPDEEHAAVDAEDAYGRAVLRSLGG